MTDEQSPPPLPSVTEIMTDLQKQNERLQRNRQALAFTTAILPTKEKLLREAMKSLEYYQQLVPELANEIALLRKRYEFSVKFCAEHDGETEKMIEANKIAAKIRKLEKDLLILREKQAEQDKTNLSPDVGQ